MGGGERYLLQTVSVFQLMGYHVDVLVFANNMCTSVGQLMDVAEGLRVPLIIDKLALQVIDHADNRLLVESQYDVFWLLGNEKYPEFAPAGVVNFYMCQFPFDLEREVPFKYLSFMSGYDYTLLNSVFTYKWHSRLVETHYINAYTHGMLVPQVEILYPPVEPYEIDESVNRTNAIAMIGRIFSGRQSKGHDTAIRVFKTVLPLLPNGTQLYIMGNLMKGFDDWLDELKYMAEGLPVEFIVAQPPKVVESYLAKAKVFWHLTGSLVDEEQDPASIEHFGIAVAESMTAGLIPIVMDKGGVRDIVENNVSGFRCRDEEEFGLRTVELLNMSDERLEEMRVAAKASVKRFSVPNFSRTLSVLTNRGFYAKPFRHLVEQGNIIYRQKVFTAAKASDRVAVIIEPRQHYAMEFVVKNAAMHLGEGWMIHVFHGLTNERYVRTVCSGVRNVKFTKLPLTVMTIPDYNDLLKSYDFWTSLEAQHALTFQTDSAILGYDIDRFIGASYIGAPWHLENERWILFKKILPIGVGNGGFSLRKVADMLYVINKYSAYTNNTDQEDVFFSRNLQRDGMNVSSRSIAYQFCVEVRCRDLDLEGIAFAPSAVHAAWYYLSHDKEQLHALLQRAL